jgi:hypothetical protein
MNVRCPQCGTEFDKHTNEFCPNCGYPSAFILTPEAEGPEPEEMLRRPGEEVTVPQAPIPPPQPTVPRPTPAPVAPIQPTVPTPAVQREPPRRRFPTALVVGGIVAVLAVVVLILLLTSGNDQPTANDGSPGQATPSCQTGFFQGSLGDRVLGPCPAEMRGSDVQQLQLKLNQVLQGERVLSVDASFGPRTAAAVRDYQQCRGIQPANSIVDRNTAVTMLQDGETDACPTSLPDRGPPQSQPQNPTESATPTTNPSPSASPTVTLLSPVPT